jgi:ribonucleotide reductase alpha subunit
MTSMQTKDNQIVNLKVLPPPPFNTVGLFTYLRTYARRHNDADPNSTVESWSECIERVVKATNTQLKVGFTNEESTELFSLLYNLKCSVAGRFLWQLGTKTVDKMGLMSLQNCFTVDTKFWTKEGIKSFSNYNDGDVVVVRGKDKWVNATIKSYQPQQIYELTVGLGKGKRIIRTTANHRWIVKTKKNDNKFTWKIKTTSELCNGWKLQPFANRTNFQCLQICPVGIQHGIVFGDGHQMSNVNSCGITLCGDKKEELSKFFFTVRRENNMITGLPSTWKDLPSLNMNKEYLYGFLAGWFSTDGSIQKSSQMSITNKNEDVLLWAKSAFSILGIITSPVRLSSDENPFNANPRELYKLEIYRYHLPSEFFIRDSQKQRYKKLNGNPDWRVVEVKPTNDIEPVWCVNEPEFEEFTLEDGILTKNCAFVTVNEPVKPFTWVMNFLMLGAGCGYRISLDDIKDFPIVKSSSIIRRDEYDSTYIVPDSREGWVKLLGKVLKAHFYSGESFTYSCVLLRSRGAVIKGFGGLSSGPEVLCDGIKKINDLLNKRAGMKIKSVDALDIMNIIGMIVVSGNVRRSAQLALGDCEDTEYLRAKRWDLGNIPNWRCYSNNSIICNNIEEILKNNEFWDAYNGNGEPYGLINLKLSQTCGRIGETQYPDPNVAGYNPCFSGDTLIAVADGRGAVPIKDLATEDKDVPVYSVNPESGEVSIKWGRNPRITGTNMKLLRIHFGGQHKEEYMDVTPNHKFFTTDGRDLTAEQLVKGDSIPMFKKCKNGKDDYIVIKDLNGKRLTEHRMIKKFYNPDDFEKQHKQGIYNGCCKTDNVVIHHKDENKSNNNPDNLEITTASDHSRLHGEELIGDKNPMYGKKHSDQTKSLIGQKTKERCKNPDYITKLSNAMSDENRDKMSIKMSIQKKEWDHKIWDELEQKANDAGLKTVRLLEDGALRVVRECEICNAEFNVIWGKRGQPYCSYSCANKNKDVIEKRRVSNRATKDAKSKHTFYKQAMVYKDLQENSEIVMKKDWENECRKKGIPFRIQTKTPNPYIPTNWTHFKQMVTDLNHRVSYVEELPDTHTVYNITVEDNHTLAVVTKSNDEKINLSGVWVYNCAEQSLESYETCCLGEIYLPNITSKDELFKCATYLYRICKHSLALNCPDSKETENIVHKNMRMGLGVTGYLQATEEQKSWLPLCYNYLRVYDKQYSHDHGFSISIKLTTCKPSGTLSLLGGCTSGIHPGFSRYYIRRIRISSESKLIELAKKNGYPVEYSKNFDQSIDPNTQIVSFPYSLPEGTVFADECTALQQLEYVKRLQTEWSDNSVSCTVYYRKEELDDIKEWLRKNYNNSIKSVSFLLHSDHGFQQAPLEKISKEQYDLMKSQCNNITSTEGICFSVKDEEFVGEGECANGSCPIR